MANLKASKLSAIVLVSGGMDSCVTAAIAKAENDEIAFLHISYGQLTEKRERKAFNDIADFYGVEKRLDVSIEYLTKIGGSSLTDENIEVSEADLESREIPTSYVPFRNANMLSISARFRKIRAVIPIADRNFTRRLKKQSKRVRNPKPILKSKHRLFIFQKPKSCVKVWT